MTPLILGLIIVAGAVGFLCLGAVRLCRDLNRWGWEG